MAVAAVIAHVAPFAWMRLPADFAWASYVLAYCIGADRAAARRRRTASATPLDPPAYVPRWLRQIWLPLLRISAWVLALAYLWYALLEAAGVFWSLTVRREFFVIRKPRLTHTNEPHTDVSRVREPPAREPQRQPASASALEPVGAAHP